LADFELICAGCDAFLMVVRARRTERDLLKHVAAQLDTKKLVGVVFNGAETFSKEGYGAQYAYSGHNRPTASE
jgi:hypothetical protein